MKKINLIGDRYGRLIVLKELNKRHGVKKERVFQCLCDCGNKVEVPIGMLRNGNKKSCGCLQREARYAVEVVKRKIRRRATVHSFDDAIKIRNQWLIEYFENPSKWIEDTKNKSFIRKI